MNASGSVSRIDFICHRENFGSFRGTKGAYLGIQACTVCNTIGEHGMCFNCDEEIGASPFEIDILPSSSSGTLPRSFSAICSICPWRWTCFLFINGQFCLQRSFYYAAPEMSNRSFSIISVCMLKYFLATNKYSHSFFFDALIDLIFAALPSSSLTTSLSF